MALPNNGNGVSLAMRLEEDSSIRRLVRETKSLTQWKNKNLIGVASTDAAAYNAALLRHVAAWYTPQVPMPQAIPIEAIRAEAQRFKQCLPHKFIWVRAWIKAPGPHTIHIPPIHTLIHTLRYCMIRTLDPYP